MKKLIFLLFAINLFAYNVTVSIIPQKFVVNKIAGNKANVNVMVLPGNEPESYNPTPKQLMSLRNSAIYFKIGVPFEKAWINKFIAINPKIKIIDVTKGIQKDKNPHVWLAPQLIKQQALNVKNALIEYDAKNREFYENNYKNFIKEIDETDKKITKLLKPLKNRTFIIFHPSLYYFAKEYNLNEIALEKEGKEPSLQYQMRLIKTAKEKNIKIVLTSPEFSQKSAKFIAQKIDGKVVSFSPLKYNILENLLEVSKVLNESNRD
jgi:zinc transport system substrate-binding protein